MYLCKREADRDFTQKRKMQCDNEGRVMWPQAEEYGQSPKAGRSKEWILP